jgi:hypothetical protein
MPAAKRKAARGTPGGAPSQAEAIGATVQDAGWL